jgi:hypothetical protein
MQNATWTRVATSVHSQYAPHTPLLSRVEQSFERFLAVAHERGTFQVSRSPTATPQPHTGVQRPKTIPRAKAYCKKNAESSTFPSLASTTGTLARFAFPRDKIAWCVVCGHGRWITAVGDLDQIVTVSGFICPDMTFCLTAFPCNF